MEPKAHLMGLTKINERKIIMSEEAHDNHKTISKQVELHKNVDKSSPDDQIESWHPGKSMKGDLADILEYKEIREKGLSISISKINKNGLIKIAEHFELYFFELREMVF